MSSLWSTSKKSPLWPHNASEISLRDEASKILREDEGRLGLLRRIIRDTNNQPVLCNCRDVATKDTYGVHICDRCLNEGYRWREEWIYFHKMSGLHGSKQMHDVETLKQPGVLHAPLDIFYLEYSILPTILDSIIEVRIDSEGGVVQPVIRSGFHNIKAVEEFRLDGGRVEFYQCSCAQRTIGFFGQPLLERVPSPGRV